jgi:hypothetical protein
MRVPLCVAWGGLGAVVPQRRRPGLLVCALNSPSNKDLELTAASVRSCVAPASGRG